MKEFWNERYQAEAFAYGIAPNDFFKEKLVEIPAGGSVLFAAEGEGRNAVYAATQGYKGSAFDMSVSGKEKALMLAEKQGVSIDYQVADLESVHYDTESFDALVLIYSHFPAEIRAAGLEKLCSYVKPGGKLIFECFAKEQFGRTSGGPKNSEMLFSIAEVKQLFPELEFNILEQCEITLNEGLYHRGEGSVVRFVASKLSK
ncbi:methyltransferase [Neptunitalea chrysea]|uniref:Methyltransferase n=1 Tax=Neptunitalea chrysea TaxID=1647581 RepID=A0A9W6B3B3_9FLAO|nr:class I SAM-dependent methyltransferase [Neptunitalea chrysea]GLB51520.1 methyltransferase [Neptunitalea chrysea]